MLLLPLAFVTMADRARSQTKPRTPSSEAFSACREQEKIGDARACWALWMQQFRASGSEAEVAFAAEHTKGLKAPATPLAAVPVASPRTTPNPAAIASSTVSFTSAAPSFVDVDGKRVGSTPITGLPVQPGDHTAVFQRVIQSGGRAVPVSAWRAFSVESGEAVTIAVKAEEFSDATAPETAQASVPTTDDDGLGAPIATAPAAEPSAKPVSAGYRPGDVLDLCALEPKKDSTKFQKQRTVVFAPAGAPQVNDDPKIQQANGARLVRDIFTARLPLQRFHNVVTELPSRKEWGRETSLELSNLVSYVKQPDDEGDPERTARLDHERQFVAYSLACTDYVVVPTITSHETKWEDQKVKTKQGGEQTVKMLSLKLGGTLAIFKRDGTMFRRIALIEASVPSLVDMMSDTAATVGDLAASSLPKVGGVDVLSAMMAIPEVPKYVSAVPDPECLVGKIGRDGVGSLSGCLKGEATVEQAFGNLDERLGTVCRKSRSASEKDRDELMVECEVRARTFQLARAFQKQARSVEGWKLFGVLAKTEKEDAVVALGREEGVKVGYAFQIVDEGGERIAFYKVTDVGAGGERGDQEPSTLTPRSGEAPEGAKLEEYPQMGLVLTPFAAVALMTGNFGATTLRDGTRTVAFSLPSIVVGGGANFGWDLSPLLGWTEAYGRVDGGAFVGSGPGTQALIIPIDLWFEKGFYLGNIITLVTALGPAMQIAKLTVLTPSPGWPRLPSDLHLSTTQYGAAARLGLDFYLGPDWGLRTETFARLPFTAASYSEGDNKPIPLPFMARSDQLVTLGLNLGVTKEF